MKQDKKIITGGLILAVLAILIFSVPPVTGQNENDTHPELSEQEMLIACADCHRETTPDLEKEWFDSVHGIGMVKCYQCHGTFETFKISPAKADCATCHLDMLDKEGAKDKACWECHVPHSFKAEE